MCNKELIVAVVTNLVGPIAHDVVSRELGETKVEDGLLGSACLREVLDPTRPPPFPLIVGEISDVTVDKF